jgi:5-methylcytosine-specific restriction endonuclease McrA
MKGIQPKIPRLRLPKDAYQQLRLRVLTRDNWRCQNCGRRQNVEVHHKEHRSQGGHDSAENLITLCSTCHAEEHSKQKCF